jgi:hypothetical protein
VVIGTIVLYPVPATFWSSMSLCENINDDIELEVVLEKTLIESSPDQTRMSAILVSCS